MYPYLWIRIKKFLKVAYNRYFSTKRERTTSLQECLDHQPVNSKSLWKNWFLLLLVAPTVYYVTFIRSVWQDDFKAPAPKPLPKRASTIKTTTTVKIMTPWEYEKSSIYRKTHERAMQNREYREEFSENPEVLAITDYEEKKIRTYAESLRDTKDFKGSSLGVEENVSIPWCRYRITSDDTVKFENVSRTQWYMQKVKQGGYYSPHHCKSRHKVAIIVPYRDRQMNLAVFLFTIHPFLIDQMLEYRIFVVEQYGNDLFNKGRLFNVGYTEAKKLGHWHCLILHDVDLLPMNKRILYSCPIWPRHMCPTLVERGKKMWNFHTYFGGVAAMTMKQYASVNGFSNLYWGWGGEDTDMFWRVKGAGFPMGRYQKYIAKYLTLPHERRPECKNKEELLKTAIGRYSNDGLSTLKYKVVSIKLRHLYTYILADINLPVDNATTVLPNKIKYKVQKQLSVL